MPDTQNTPLMQIYEDLLATGEIKDDSAQRQIITHFDQLLYDLQHKPKPERFSFLEWLNNEKHERFIKGIYLWGDVGRGKSMLMDMFFNHIPDAIPARRLHFHEFMTEIHDALYAIRQSDNINEDPLPDIAKDFAKDCQVLCLDEFQVSDIADAMILSRLFEALIAEGVITVTTSNRPPDGLYANGLQRSSFLPFIALVKQRFEILSLVHNTDYRLEKLRGSDVYFQPANNIQPLDKLFNSLTHSSVQATTMHVKGRDITIDKTANGIAWASFSELCEEALGAEDYNILANRFHTLFLTGIPRMNKEHRNEAKRFVLLIDAIYESRTRLICSADAPAHELYSVGDGSFEFQRTVSRLIEMQSESYIGSSNHI